MGFGFKLKKLLRSFTLTEKEMNFIFGIYSFFPKKLFISDTHTPWGKLFMGLQGRNGTPEKRF